MNDTSAAMPYYLRVAKAMLILAEPACYLEVIPDHAGNIDLGVATPDKTDRVRFSRSEAADFADYLDTKIPSVEPAARGPMKTLVEKFRRFITDAELYKHVSEKSERLH